MVTCCLILEFVTSLSHTHTFAPFRSPQTTVRAYNWLCQPTRFVCAYFEAQAIVNNEQPLSKLATALQSPSTVADNTHVPDISPCHAHNRHFPISKVHSSSYTRFPNCSKALISK